MTEWLGMPPLAAAHGGQIDNLIGWIHIFMLILFVGFFIYLRKRAKRIAEVDLDTEWSELQRASRTT